MGEVMVITGVIWPLAADDYVPALSGNTSPGRVGEEGRNILDRYLGPSFIFQ